MAAVSFSKHALFQMARRGASKEEVRQAIEGGEKLPAKKGRVSYRKNFEFDSEWNGKYYQIK